MREDWKSIYNAAMDSVELIRFGRDDQDDREWSKTVRANVNHLKTVVGKEWPEDWDLSIIQETIEENDWTKRK
jgi:hypothetical protein